MVRTKDSKRVWNPLRRAAWEGAGRLFGAQAVVFALAAILYPVTQQKKFSGFKLNADVVARAIGQTRQESGRWPTTFEDIRPQLSRRDGMGPHRVSFFKLKGEENEAEYTIAFDGSLQTVTIDADRGVQRLVRVASGTLPK